MRVAKGPEQNAHNVHDKAIVVDACSFYFYGYSPQIAEGKPTALVVTVPRNFADFEAAIAAIERHHRLVEAEPEKLVLIRRAGDLTSAKTAGRVGLIMGFQNAKPIGEDLSRVRTFWRLGVRVVQLTYSGRNAYGDGCLEPANSGLSRLGKQVIREMNDVGILIDLAHVGLRTSLEAIAASEQPVIISHANPRKLADNPRNVTDDQIKAIAESGGVVGACGWSPICWRGGSEKPGVQDLVAHIDYMVGLVGIDHVGLGLDSPASGLGTVAEHAAETNKAFPEVVGGYVSRFGEGLEGRYAVPVWSLPAVTEALLQRGYSVEDTSKVLGLNFMRVFAKVWRD